MSNIFATQTQEGEDLSFTLTRGLPWTDEVQLVDGDGNPISLAGITDLWMRIRSNPDNTEHILELKKTNGKLVIIDDVNGIYRIVCDDDDTLKFPRNSSRKADYYSDSVVERSPGIYEPGASAMVYVNPQVTKPQDPT